ncbi:MAG: energy-coupling factor transporter transmembrane protein EcfT [Candidatus Micrarchaeia archaeon]
MIAYIPRNSLVHKIDARVKILYLIFLLFLLILRQSFEILIATSLVIPLLYIIAEIPLAQPVKDLGKGWLLILLPAVLHILIHSYSGALLGVLTSLFFLNIFLISLLMVYTTEMKKILQALVFFKTPGDIAFAFIIAVHFVPFMQQEVERIRISQVMRGYSPSPFSLPLPLIIPLLHSSLKRSSQLAVSLESRGFDSERINFEVELRMGLSDYLLLFLLPLLVFALF